MKWNLKAVLGVMSIVLAAVGCSTGKGKPFPERASMEVREHVNEHESTFQPSVARHRLVGDYWIAKSSNRAGDEFCVTGGTWPKWLCEETMRASAVGWDDQHLVIRIGLPSKEYLVIDVQSDSNFVVNEQSLSEWSEVSDIEVLTWDEVWNRGIETGV